MADTYLADAQRASALIQSLNDIARFGTRLGDMVKMCKERGKESLSLFKREGSKVERLRKAAAAINTQLLNFLTTVEKRLPVALQWLRKVVKRNIVVGKIAKGLAGEIRDVRKRVEKEGRIRREVAE